eukprot:TRINITY_DN10208_c0_g1_i1.p1 TRINITY_DN10208_c0_g1~~TRINITY_DN10208_c0_g1_i1.p1  ORF type:complete len:185 (-),score=3.74 TRINITY_DN10208_c0_g1_i1:581-1135(-)
MPTSSKNPRRGQEDKGRVGKLPEKAASFHGGISVSKGQILRPKTQPDLLSGRKLAGKSPENTTPPNPKLTKLLLNVTVQRSLGPVQVVTSPESTVGDLIREAVRQYVKEGRRPLLTTTDSDDFDLHYTQFSLERLDPKAMLMTLGSRNFFMCPKSTAATSCSNQAANASKKINIPWLRFMDFLL